MKRIFQCLPAIVMLLIISPPAISHAGDPSPPAKIIIVQIVQFESNSARIDKKMESKMDEIIQRIQSSPELVILGLDGHTDSLEKNPEALSRKRAEAVGDYFVKKGISPSNIVVNWWGKARPIADNATVKGRALNRRVEFNRLNEPPRKPGEAIR